MREKWLKRFRVGKNWRMLSIREKWIDARNRDAKGLNNETKELTTRFAHTIYVEIFDILQNSAVQALPSMYLAADLVFFIRWMFATIFNLRPMPICTYGHVQFAVRVFAGIPLAHLLIEHQLPTKDCSSMYPHKASEMIIINNESLFAYVAVWFFFFFFFCSPSVHHLRCVYFIYTIWKKRELFSFFIVLLSYRMSKIYNYTSSTYINMNVLIPIDWCLV